MTRYGCGIIILSAALWHAQPSLAGGAESVRRGWDIEPHGRAWSDFYSPHDSASWWDFGLDLTMWYRNPTAFAPFMYLQMRTQAGYDSDPNTDGPRTPVDLLHQIWQQGLGVEWSASVPLYFFAYRDCNHQLDKGGFEPVLATTFMLAAGPLPPFRSDFQNFAPGDSRIGFSWLVAAGPSPISGEKSMWQSQSAVRSETWLRGLGAYRLWPHGVLNAFGELIGQTSSIEPTVRHVFRTDFGLSIDTGERAWRFFLGRRWRDTRELWPVDQKTYFGLEYSY